MTVESLFPWVKIETHLITSQQLLHISTTQMLFIYQTASMHAHLYLVAVASGDIRYRPASLFADGLLRRDEQLQQTRQHRAV